MDPIAMGDVTSDTLVGPFHRLQRAMGATFYEDYGALWTASFGDPVSEYWAVRRDVGLWDTSALVKFHITGRDALTALDRLTTRRVADAEPGLVRYGMLLDEDGLMLDEATIIVISAEEAYLLGNDGDAEFLEHMVTNTNGMDVQFANVSKEIPCFAVQGPRSFEVLAKLTSVDIEPLRWFRCITDPVEIAGVSGLLVRAGFTGELGYEFYLLDGWAGAEDAWDAVVQAGVAPIGLDAIQKLRIEAGLVISEEDYFPGSTDPLDLGMERFIDFIEHDFIGRDAVSRRMGHAHRRFVTLELPDAEVPDHGAAVTTGGEIVGDVRSADTTPRFGTLGLSVVDATYSTPGTLLAVGGHPALVRPVPIDDPEKLRPRSDPRNPRTAV